MKILYSLNICDINTNIADEYYKCKNNVQNTYKGINVYVLLNQIIRNYTKSKST